MLTAPAIPTRGLCARIPPGHQAGVERGRRAAEAVLVGGAPRSPPLSAPQTPPVAPTTDTLRAPESCSLPDLPNCARSRREQRREDGEEAVEEPRGSGALGLSTLRSGARSREPPAAPERTSTILGRSAPPLFTFSLFFF
ncbi:unnamed protein product [Tetraodon nigroviridis]|uniref:(spotted green pufferfish) hypothetical protein n=1 Tax=Tetraodon nigroviridis TaxID=99883 RepID=Q4S5X6_TETNG|nr:unnamed protein product [Tetraodon nigroviridis]